MSPRNQSTAGLRHLRLSSLPLNEQGVVVGEIEEGGDRIRTLAEFIEEQHQESLPELHGFAADLMSAALSEVNWEEIATSLLSDAKEALAD